MLNFEELKQLEELKKQFIKATDILNYEFSDAELSNIFEEIEKYPEDRRTKDLWQTIIKQKSGAKLFKLYEAFDYTLSFALFINFRIFITMNVPVYLGKLSGITMCRIIRVQFFMK